jgi:atypical dual specificity phosphatase
LANDPFRWLIPGVLAGGPHLDPFHEPETLTQALADLRNAGIGQIITLVELPLEVPSESGIEMLHVPTLDGEPPEDLEALCAFIDGGKLRGVGTFVHCVAGQGRTGTVLAAYLIWSEQRRAWDAVDEVRRVYNPRAVESPQQLDALEAFERRHRLV